MRKRVAACFCAVLVLVNCVLFPFRARATAGALAAVGAAVTVSAFLMACGVYPYISEDGQSFGEWGADSLYDLWTQYADSFEGGNLPSGGTVETFNQIKAFVVGNTLAIASGTWETLRGFASWIVSRFSVQDNQTDVVLGTIDTFPLLPYGYGTLLDVGGGNALGSIPAGLRVCYQLRAQGDYRCWCGSGRRTTPAQVTVKIPGSETYVSTDNTTYGGYEVALLLPGGSWRNPAIVVANEQRNMSIPVFDNSADVGAYISGALTLPPSVHGVTADTTTVTPLEALPADTPYGGLAVPGAGAYPTAETVLAVIQTGVTDREKPVVTPVEVELGQGVTVDEDTGAVEVTENPVLVTPEEVAPSVAALTPSAAFLEALQTTMTTKFPFCLPFDLFKILQAFYVAPEAPVFYLSFHDPFSNSDFSIRVDLSPWDNVAAVVRNFEAMILLAGFCLNFDKFNVIHLILGGLG